MSDDELIQAAQATLEQLESKREHLIRLLPNLHEPGAVGDGAGQDVGLLNDLEILLSRGKQVVKQADEFKDLAGRITSGLLSEIDEAGNEIAERTEQLRNAREQGRAAIESMLDEKVVSLREHVLEQVADLQEMVNELVEQLEERTEEVKERFGELKEQGEAQVEELFEKIIPDSLESQTAGLTRSLERLDEAGGRELEKLESALGAIQDKAKVLLDFVDEAKPVLKLAAQIL